MTVLQMPVFRDSMTGRDISGNLTGASSIYPEPSTSSCASPALSSQGAPDISGILLLEENYIESSEVTHRT